MNTFDIQKVVEILKGCGQYRQSGHLDGAKLGGGVVVDSRKVASGDIFIAYKGVSADGHVYLEAAMRSGAGCLILEDAAHVGRVSGYPHIVVKDSREAWAYLAALSHGNPQTRLKFIGITGTNGKTSSVWMIRQLLDALGHPCMSIGTLGTQIGCEVDEASHTTPDPDQLFAHLAEACRRGITYVAMEVTSHSLEQHKLGPIRFMAVGFTSFSQDHLDYHETMAQYLAAKKRLFTDYLTGKDAFVNLHESVVPLMRDLLPCGRLAIYGEGDYPVEVPHDVHPQRNRFWPVAVGPSASEVDVALGDLMRTRLRIPFFGDVFLANFLGALAIVTEVTGQTVPAAMCEGLLPVPGRMEPVQAAPRQPGVFVDYAHTPDAIEKVLRVARGFLKGDLWVVFGCGGDRDRKKRPLMAKVAEQGANHVVVTSDNPRTEEPGAIIKDILAGFAEPQAVNVIELREEAIAHAIKHAKADDLIVVAGKGHEDYQIMGRVKTPFDDRLMARKYLERFWVVQEVKRETTIFT